MKMKKLMISLIAGTIVLLAVCFGQPAYAASSAAPSDSQESLDEQYLLMFMEALRTRDDDLAYEIWLKGGQQLTSERLTELYDFWNGREVTSYRKVYEEQQPQSGIRQTYEITSGSKTFLVEFSTTDNNQGGKYIHYFNISPGSAGISQYSEPSWFRVARIVMPIVNLAEIGFTLYVARLCLKDKPRFWGLWLAFILLAYGGISISLLRDIEVGAFIQMFRLPRITLYMGVGIQAYLSIPFGAIVYQVRRKQTAGKRVPAADTSVDTTADTTADTEQLL